MRWNFALLVVALAPPIASADPYDPLVMCTVDAMGTHTCAGEFIVGCDATGICDIEYEAVGAARDVALLTPLCEPTIEGWWCEFHESSIGSAGLVLWYSETQGYFAVGIAALPP